MDSTILFLFNFLLIFACLLQTQAGHLKITTVLTEPYISKSSKSGKTTYHGYLKDLLDKLSDDVGFTYDLYPVPDGKFGRQNSDGNWTGTVAEVLDGRADMIAAPITVTSKRTKVLDFSHPFQTVNLAIVLRRPEDHQEPVADRLKRIWVPFESSVWLLTVAAYFITSSAIYIISYYNPYDWRKMGYAGEATIREAESFSCMNSFWFAISAIALQGYVRAPRSIGARIVVTAWWLFVLALVSCYISKLTSLLQIRPNEEEIEGYMKFQGLRDLAKQDIKFVVIEGGAVHEFFLENDQLEYVKQLREELLTRKNGGYVSSVMEGIKELQNYPSGKKALITESMMVHYQTQKLGCEFYFVNENVLKRQFSFGLPKNSSLTDEIGFYVLKYHEHGFLAHLEEKWFKGACKQFIYDGSDEKYKIPEFHALDTASFSGALLVLAIGLIIGGLISVVECFVFKWAEGGEHEKKDGVISQQDEPGPSTSLMGQSNDKPGTQV